MPEANANATAPLYLICGEDDFSVKKLARQVYKTWCEQMGGDDHEVIEASASNSDEALKLIARLYQSLQTLPFFGSGKVIWFKDCNFLAEDRVSASSSVSQAMTELSETLKTFKWQSVRLVFSAGKTNRTRSFFKTCQKIGKVDFFEALSLDAKDWADKAEDIARHAVQERKKEITDEALASLIQAVGPDLQQLTQEIEKLSLYLADRTLIEEKDVDAVVTRQKQARAFALADALGDRNLVRLLRTLEEEMWSLKQDKSKSEIGLLYGLISKVRGMLFAKEMLREGLLRQEEKFFRFKTQLDSLPPERFPEDKKISPLGMNPYILFRAMQQCANYTREELVRAMELLLLANLKFVSSKADEATVFQQTLVEIVGVDNKRNP